MIVDTFRHLWENYSHSDLAFFYTGVVVIGLFVSGLAIWDNR